MLIIVGLFIRLRIFETPLFAQVKEQKMEARAPLAEAFRHSTPEILLSAGARFVEQAPFYLFTVFVITYGISKSIHIERGVILNAITIAAGWLFVRRLAKANRNIARRLSAQHNPPKRR